MTYQVTHTDSTNPLKPPYTVVDGTLNNQTSLQFVGKGYTGFAPIIANDLLHLLENFAASSAPTNPVQGQLWFDTNDSLLRVYDGTNWNEAGSIKKSSTSPGLNVSAPGDLWVNTATSQLYLFSGSSWLLVGPQFSQGLRTGPVVEQYVDTNNVTHTVLSFYASKVSDSLDHIISIISADTFIPKAPILGFAKISQGVNLTTAGSTDATTPTRFHGTATSADSLLISGNTVPSTNFLRNDVSSNTNYPLSVSHDGGISVGASLGFNISIASKTVQMLSTISNGSIDFILNNSSNLSTVLHIGSTNRVGIGTNNTSPLSTLDVNGIITASGSNGAIVVQSTSDIADVGGASIQTAGGLNVAKTGSFGSIQTSGPLTINAVSGTTVLVPSTSGSYDIGSASNQFRNVYATTFNGTFLGNLTGIVTGSVNGTASALASATVFSLAGDVTSNNVSFNGQTSSGTAVFTTTMSDNVISGKTSATDSILSDYLLVYRQGSGLLKMSKKVFMNHVATMPIGTILPYAGATAPTGYLFCDGSEVLVSSYPDLYSIIGYAYKAASTLVGVGTFALPDLRGRFPLGADNMNNRLTVPSKQNSSVKISAGGGTANRVSDVTADTVGTGSGNQTITTSTTTFATAGSSTSHRELSASSYNVMNPYQTINYIIFTGVI